ncbi:hydrogenase [Thermococcus sp. CX2]|nr:hydrogenase [Thermococcus sp. CX2]
MNASVPISLVFILLLPPFFDGLVRKIKARLQYSAGPPLLQTFYDLEKLVRLPSRVPTDNKLFVIAPYLALAAAISAALFLPYGSVAPLSFGGDVIVVLYVVAMVSVSVMLGAFSVKNSFSHIGGHREMIILLSTEPILAVSLGIFALNSGTLTVSEAPLALSLSFSTVLAYILLAYSVYVECGFLPFDVAEAEIELGGGVFVEYSGRLLGVFLYALLIKRFALIWLLSSFIVLPLVGSISWPIRLLLQLGIATAIYALFATVEGTSSRLRIDQIMRINMKVFITSLVVLALSFVGW